MAPLSLTCKNEYACWNIVEPRCEQNKWGVFLQEGVKADANQNDAGDEEEDVEQVQTKLQLE